MERWFLGRSRREGKFSFLFSQHKSIFICAKNNTGERSTLRMQDRGGEDPGANPVAAEEDKETTKD